MEGMDAGKALMERLEASRKLLFEGLLPKCPDQLLTWRPDIATESFGQLLMYASQKERIWMAGLARGEWNAPTEIPQVPATIDEGISVSRKTHEEFKGVVTELNDEKLHEIVATPFKKATRIELLYDLYEDFVHLRAVMFLFAKMNGIACPPMYAGLPPEWGDPYRRMVEELGISKVYLGGCRLNQADA